MARLFGTDGSCEDVGVLRDLEHARELVGGYVELIRGKNDALLLVDDEGKLKRLPPNENAWQIFQVAVVGPAVVLTREEAREFFRREG